MAYILAAILWLAPHQSHTAVKRYADLIAFEAKWYKVDPLLVVALIHIESNWHPRKKSVTNDYGLLQVHVARRGSATFLGREKDLYEPRTNIREGVRILAMWKNYHEKHCPGEHPYWAHFKWGKRVKHIDHAIKVRELYTALVHRFRKPSVPLLTMKGVE